MKVIYDTCLYIDFLRAEQRADIFTSGQTIRFLSPIVVMELRAGAHSAAALRTLEQLFYPYIKARRMIPLTAEMFSEAGDIMRKLADLGSLSKGISHDVLIALCAQSVGATVLTSNKKDFQNIARYLKYSYDIV